jgi:hypothetical protein
MRSILGTVLITALVCASCDRGSHASPSALPTTVALAALPGAGECNLTTPLVAGIAGSPGNMIPSTRNPNGDSELAFLMRSFVDELQDARAALSSGEGLDALYPRHQRMRCAWPTAPADRNETFDAMAQAYLRAVLEFDAAPGDTTYDNVVQHCVACHSVTCNGLLPLIETLRIQ